jgi:putative membrane protein
VVPPPETGGVPRFLVRALFAALGLWLAERLLAGIRIDGLTALLLSALLLGLCNAVVKPVLVVLTLPATVLSLGLFLLVVNGLVLALVAWLVPGFSIAGLGAAMLGALIVSLTSIVGAIATR